MKWCTSFHMMTRYINLTEQATLTWITPSPWQVLCDKGHCQQKMASQALLCPLLVASLRASRLTHNIPAPQTVNCTVYSQHLHRCLNCCRDVLVKREKDGAAPPATDYRPPPILSLPSPSGMWAHVCYFAEFTFRNESPLTIALISVLAATEAAIE